MPRNHLCERGAPLNEFEVWVPHPFVLRKGAVLGFHHLGQKPTVSQTRQRMGHSPGIALKVGETGISLVRGLILV
jgi:hypothetical protein